MGSITIISDNTLTAFGEVVLANKYRARRLWVITPWLSGENGRHDPLALLVESLTRCQCVTYLVTRPPEERWHLDAIKVLWSTVKPILLYSARLHAKLYLLECDGFRYAMFGSPNLTGRADRDNKELAVELRCTTTNPDDQIAAMIDTLTKYANSIMAEDDVEIRECP